MKKIKYGKIAIVAFLTALIWIWTDLVLDETLPDKVAVLVAEESPDPELWVSFGREPSLKLFITLTGPHSAISRFERDKQALEFSFNAVREKLDTPGVNSLALLPFLQKDKQLRRLGLKVKSCEPKTVEVNVVRLAQRTLPIECVDSDGKPLKARSIDPPKVDMYVLEQTRTAQVRLSPQEVEKARFSPIQKKPFVTLATGQIREAQKPVKVTMPPEEDPLEDLSVERPTLSFALSPNLQGKCKIKLENPEDVIVQPIAIRATREAKLAYENQIYATMTLHILDEDLKQTGELQRTVVYNFPEEYVRRGEIELKKDTRQPVEARFTITPLPPPEAASGAGQ
ncbi:MAG: hypothetical protein JSU94_20505 [Phycisphaerales bacterium]|nr:MAG: hypothetical protein JSU94_20505 [Phycisphaerales bacterium]